MDGMSLEEFESRVIAICSDSPVVRNISTLASGLTWVQLRAHLVDDSFVDIFYNQITGKTAFAQIRNDRRVFAADNKKGWHWHPREDPGSHKRSDSEITFEEFMHQVEEYFMK